MMTFTTTVTVITEKKVSKQKIIDYLSEAVVIELYDEVKHVGGGVSIEIDWSKLEEKDDG